MKFNILYDPLLKCYYVEERMFLKYTLRQFEFKHLRDFDDYVTGRTTEIAQSAYLVFSNPNDINFQRFEKIAKIRSEKDYERFKLDNAEEFI